MSLRLTLQVWEAEVPPPDMLILLCLADAASDAGLILAVDAESVAWRCNLVVATVRKRVQLYEQGGWLERVHGLAGPQGWRLHLERVPRKRPLERLAGPEPGA